MMVLKNGKQAINSQYLNPNGKQLTIPKMSNIQTLSSSPKAISIICLRFENCNLDTILNLLHVCSNFKFCRAGYNVGMSDKIA
jgi:hypothetical protein